MASSSSTTWLRNTSATDRATLIAGSGRPRVSRPTELRALMTRASSLPARPESTLYPMVVTSLLAIQLGGLRRSLVSLTESEGRRLCREDSCNWRDSLFQHAEG